MIYVECGDDKDLRIRYYFIKGTKSTELIGGKLFVEIKSRRFDKSRDCNSDILSLLIIYMIRTFSSRRTDRPTRSWVKIKSLIIIAYLFDKDEILISSRVLGNFNAIESIYIYINT